MAYAGAVLLEECRSDNFNNHNPGVDPGRHGIEQLLRGHAPYSLSRASRPRASPLAVPPDALALSRTAP